MASLKSFDKLPAPEAASLVSPLFIVILVWALSTFLITGAALLGNINWMTPRLEAKLSAMLHRNVTLGQIHWHVGLDRLSIKIDRLRITELDGKPFMGAGASEIGIEPNAFLRGDITMTYLSFTDPHMWAVQVAPNQWNFSDLIWVVENVAAVHVRGGKLHLIQQAAFGPSGGPPVSAPTGLQIAHRWIQKWRTEHAMQDCDDVFVDLIRPQKNRSWPVTISFTVPGPGYTTKVQLHAVGHGLLEDWRDNYYRYDASVNQCSAAQLDMLSPLFSHVHGLVNLRAWGDGVFNKKLLTMVQASSKELSVDIGQRGNFNFSYPSVTAELVVDPAELKIRETHFQTTELSAALNGTVKDWASAYPDYNIQLTSRIADIQSLARLIPARLLPSGFYKKHETGENLTLAQLLAPGTISGTAAVNVRLFAVNGKPEFTGTIDAQGISASNGELRSRQKLSLLSLLSEGPAHIKAQVVDIPGAAQTTQTKISFGRATIEASSLTQAATGCSTLDFVARDLNLATLSAQVVRSDDATELLRRYIAVPYTGAVGFSGGLDVNGKINYCKGRQTLTTSSQLSNAGLALVDGSLSLHNVNGSVRTTDNTIYLDQVSGFIGNGNFNVNGSENLNPPALNLSFRSQHLDLAQSNKLLQLLKIHEPLLSLLQGQAANVEMRISGTPDKPLIALSAVPQSVVYPLSGTGRIMKVTGGQVQSNGKVLSFREVTGFLGTGAFRLNGTVTLFPTQHYNVSIAAENANIEDTKSLLDVLGINVPLLYGISGVVRDANFQVSGSPSRPQITMVAHPQSVLAQLPNNSSRSVDITAGEVRLDSKNIYYRNTAGHYGKTKFTLNGSVGTTISGKYNLRISSSQADLKDIGQLLQGYGLSIPLFTRYPFSGQVGAAFVTISGNPLSPTTTFQATPVDVYFAGRPQHQSLHLTTGSITYANDRLDIKSLRMKNGHSDAVLDTSISNVSTAPSFSFLRISTAQLYLSDLNSLLALAHATDSCGVPTNWPSKYDISALEGVIKGNVLLRFAKDAGDTTYQGILSLRNVGAEFQFAHGRHRISDLNGTLMSSGNGYDGLRLTGALDATRFSLAGHNSSIRLGNPWHLKLAATIAAADFLDLLPFTTSIAAAQIVHCQPVSARADIVLKPQIPGSLTIEKSTFTLGGHPIAGKGQIAWTKSTGEPIANLVFAPIAPIPALELAKILYPNATADELAGSIGGRLNLSGPLSDLKKSGYIQLCNVSLPLLGITATTGRVTPETLSVALTAPLSLRSAVNISSARFKGQPLSDVTGQLTLRKSPIAGGPTRVAVQNLTAHVEGGVISVNGTVDFARLRNYDLDIKAQGSNAALLASRLLGQSYAHNGGYAWEWLVCGRGNPRIQLVQNLEPANAWIRKARLTGLPQLNNKDLKGTSTQEVSNGHSNSSDAGSGTPSDVLCPQAIKLARRFAAFRQSIHQQADDIRKQRTAATGALQ